jgi:ABC-type dipeptide/oligopeptide/nickel transport system permease subunit
VSEAVAFSPPQRRLRRPSFIRRFLRNRGAAVAALILVVLCVASALSTRIAPYDWSETDVVSPLSPPGPAAWFGGDLHGRDVFSRVINGGRYSISLGVVAVALSLVIGSFIGIGIGFVGGRLDVWGTRFIDVLLGIPSIVMAVLIVAVLGVGLFNAALAVAITHVPHYARVVRAATLVVRAQPFIEALRALGAGRLRIMLRHVLPNVATTLIVLATLNLGDAILSTSTLSFLGLGAQPPAPEWGAMLSDGREYMRYAPWMMIFPGLALFLTVMSVNYLGDRLSQMIDPRRLVRR